MKNKYGFWNICRLAGYPLVLGITSVLVNGTLNRIMIADMAVPASLVGLLFAVPLLVSPLRVWFGHCSDTYPICGLRRIPYILIGVVLSNIGILLVVLLVVKNDLLGWGIAGAIGAFMLFGLGKNMASNTFEALLADKFEGDRRSRAMTGFKIAMFLGIIGGAIGLGKFLEDYSPLRLQEVVFGIVVFSIIIVLLATFRQESPADSQKEAIQKAQEKPFWAAFKEVVVADSQVRHFFVFLFLALLGTQAQDVLLEPYGALVLGMDISSTSSLTALWGAGTLLALGLTGMFFVKRGSYKKIIRIGLIINVAVFLTIVLSGMIELIWLFKAAVFLLGVGTGITIAGMLMAIIEFTTYVRAGLLMGVWGVAHEMGQAAGGIFGGSIVDIVKFLTDGNMLAAYGVMFILEALLLVLALRLFSKVEVSKSKAALELNITKSEIGNLSPQR